jgi:hypothetical protein
MLRICELLLHVELSIAMLRICELLLHVELSIAMLRICELLLHVELSIKMLRICELLLVEHSFNGERSLAMSLLVSMIAHPKVKHDS